MALTTKRPKGTQDILPNEAVKWQQIEEVIRSQADLYGISEIRTPVFEHTELFLRGVGDTTDIVEKQMYTFEDKGGRSITLKPEGTASTVRAMLESGIYNDGYPQKYYYFTSCYRYERPQAGRLREFNQFGTEIFGTKEPIADAQLIMFANGILERLGINNIKLEINSIGCPVCRKKYHEALKKYLESGKDNLCETCLSRLDRNPMRILDCKNETCENLSENAPIILNYLCEECEPHFNSVKSYLDIMGVEYSVNHKIVRGLDYYSKTVFEFIAENIGAKSTVLGGGRYDGLVEELGGKPTPALGFGMGIERLILLMESQNIEFPSKPKCEVFFAAMGEKALQKAIELAELLISCGITADYDICGRGLKAQLKYASKIGAENTVVIGDNELETMVAEIKNMSSGEKIEISLTQSFLDEYIAKVTANFDMGMMNFM